MVLSELLQLPSMKIPVSGKVVNLEVKLPVAWVKEIETRCDELRSLAKKLGYEENVPGISLESLVQGLVFFYLNTDGGWANLVGPTPD